jgi:hypothetical protein
MAQYPTQHHWNGNPFDDVDFKSYDYVIGGKLVVGHASLSDEYFGMMHGDPDAKYNVKMQLATQLATFMIENKLVEFTQSDNRHDGSKRIAIRAYLAPDEQVKILRVANKIV